MASPASSSPSSAREHAFGQARQPHQDRPDGKGRNPKGQQIERGAGVGGKHRLAGPDGEDRDETEQCDQEQDATPGRPRAEHSRQQDGPQEPELHRQRDRPGVQQRRAPGVSSEITGLEPIEKVGRANGGMQDRRGEPQEILGHQEPEGRRIRNGQGDEEGGKDPTRPARRKVRIGRGPRADPRRYAARSNSRKRR